MRTEGTRGKDSCRRPQAGTFLIIPASMADTLYG